MKKKSRLISRKNSKRNSELGITKEKMLLIVGILVLIVGGGLFLVSNKTNQLEKNNYENIVTQQSLLEAYRFYPLKVQDVPIKPLGGKYVKTSGDPYYVYATGISQYSLPGEGNPVPLNQAYKAFYGTSDLRTFTIETYNLTFEKDRDDFIQLSNAWYGTKKIEMEFDHPVTYWSVYDDLVKEDEYAGEVRILLETQPTVVKMKFGKAFTKDEFIAIVKEYINTIYNQNDNFVSNSDILSEADYLNLKGQ